MSTKLPKTLVPVTHVLSVSLAHPTAAQDSDPQLLRRVSSVGPVGPVCSVCSVGLNSHFERFLWSLMSVGGAARCTLSCRYVSILYASSDRYSGWASLGNSDSRSDRTFHLPADDRSGGRTVYQPVIPDPVRLLVPSYKEPTQDHTQRITL